jgi:hypothetical protein
VQLKEERDRFVKCGQRAIDVILSGKGTLGGESGGGICTPAEINESKTWDLVNSMWKKCKVSLEEINR